MCQKNDGIHGGGCVGLSLICNSQNIRQRQHDLANKFLKNVRFTLTYCKCFLIPFQNTLIYSDFLSMIGYTDYKCNPDSLDDYVKEFMKSVLEVNCDFKKVYESKQLFATVFKLFVKCPVSTKSFNLLTSNSESSDDSKRFESFENIYTAQEEAFIYVILESNFAKWIAECAHKLEVANNNPTFFKAVKITKQVRERSNFPPSKYTKVSKQEYNLNTGWTREGIEVFNSYVSSVDEFRKSKDFRAFALFSMDYLNKRIHVVIRPERNDEAMVRKQKERELYKDALTTSYKRCKFA